MLTKFPEVFYNKKQLIWDYRQKVISQDAVLFIRNSLTIEQRELLKETFPSLPVIEETPRLIFSEIIAEHFNFPSKKMRLIGVTGSNGKSSTCYFGAQLAALSGEKSAVVGTLGIEVFEKNSAARVKRIETGFTSPDSPMLQMALDQLLHDQVRVVFMEVSSHSLALDRVGGVDFDAGVFLNLTQDHLDFHKTMDEYYQAKRLLFSKYLKSSSKNNIVGVFSSVDSFGEKLGQESFGYPCVSLNEKKNIEILCRDLSGMGLRVDGKQINLKLFGDFNANNFFAAYKVLEQLVPGVKQKIFDFAPKLVPPKGRMQPVKTRGVGLAVVDYAHTPDALEKALMSLKSFVPASSKLYCVFGCGGNRDKTKRPQMGKIAAQLSDVVVVTSDNPRDEDPNEIIRDILEGINGVQGKSLLVEVDRKKAIEMACATAGASDVILVAGKGHEDYQIIKGVKSHFDDTEILLKYPGT